jgi:DNA (cytosine-5)-methyltransferase 1
LIDENPDGVAWHTPEETGRLLKMMSPKHKELVDYWIATGKKAVGMLYKRTRNGEQRAEIRFDGIAGCLRTPKGGSSRQTILVADNHQVRSRLLSPREAARLMGAGEDFWLPPGYNDAYKAMGDAVVVPVVSWLSDHLLAPLAEASRNEPGVNKCSKLIDRERIYLHRANAQGFAAMWGDNRVQAAREMADNYDVVNPNFEIQAHTPSSTAL